jgi:hypothetical protein
MNPIARSEAERLFQAQRDYAKTQAEIRARVDAEIARRAEHDRLHPQPGIINECPHCGRDCEPRESLCGDSDCPRHD